jgi:putative chitinase
MVMDKILFKAATAVNQITADKWYEPVAAAFIKYGITKPEHIAAWLAQFGHESASFSAVVENMNYSANGLVTTWPSRFSHEQSISKKYALDYARKPEKIGNFVYADRMGNGSESSGDGYRYRGRGLAMITGKAYYSACSKGIGVDLITNPELLEQPLIAAESAAWVWKDKFCNEYINRDDFKGLTRAINGGLIGLEDREKRWLTARNAMGIK